jgi:hypothetical protein
MITHKRLFFALLTLGLGLGLALAGTAAAGTRTYSVAKGSGGQLQIGGGLPLPIQATCNVLCTGTVFPPLLIPRVETASVTQTTTRTTAQKLMVPKGVLSKPAAFNILGQADNNPALYAVATNINYTWPATAAVFSTAARTGTTSPLVSVGGGKSIKYSNALGRKFGGPAQFALKLGAPGPPGGGGPPGDLKANAAATLYFIAVQPTGQPPCTHPGLGGANPACVAAIANLLPTGGTLPTGFAAMGGGQPASPVSITTPGGTPAAVIAGGPIPGVGVVKAGASPRGTISLFAYTPAGTMTGQTAMAQSSGFPWTTGMLTIVATAAGGAGETWQLTGRDGRNATGAGVIQMVSGALSTRNLVGDNANRGWVKLVLSKAPHGVPALSPPALAATAALMLLAAGYAMRRRFSA